jgi:hypothetical protein
MNPKKLRKLLKGYGKHCTVIIERVPADVRDTYESEYQVWVYSSAEDVLATIDVGENF